MFVIEDAIHADPVGTYERLDDAIAELRRRAAIPWDERPNQAPCVSSRTCGREYELQEYDASRTPWELLRSVLVLRVSAKGVEWVDDPDRMRDAGGESSQ
jgi:hypothetical protein